MHQVQIDSMNRTLPSSWDELNRRQLLFVSSLFNSGTSLSEFKMRCLYRFLKIKKRVFLNIDPPDAFELGETLNFLFEQITLTKALISSLRPSRFPLVRLHGPDDAMGYCTFGEFTKAQVRYEEYCDTKKPAILDELIAILFRRKKPFWWLQRYFVETTDPRVRFMDRNLKSRSRLISTLDERTKYAIFIFFSGVVFSLPKHFPNVYKPRSSSSGGKLSGWASLIISLADGRTDDHSLERIMNSNMYNVFLGLEQKAIEYFDYLAKNPTV